MGREVSHLRVVGQAWNQELDVGLLVLSVGRVIGSGGASVCTARILSQRHNCKVLGSEVLQASGTLANVGYLWRFSPAWTALHSYPQDSLPVLLSLLKKVGVGNSHGREKGMKDMDMCPPGLA